MKKYQNLDSFRGMPFVVVSALVATLLVAVSLPGARAQSYSDYNFGTWTATSTIDNSRMELDYDATTSTSYYKNLHDVIAASDSSISEDIREIDTASWTDGTYTASLVTNPANPSTSQDGVAVLQTGQFPAFEDNGPYPLGGIAVATTALAGLAPTYGSTIFSLTLGTGLAENMILGFYGVFQNNVRLLAYDSDGNLIANAFADVTTAFSSLNYPGNQGFDDGNGLTLAADGTLTGTTVANSGGTYDSSLVGFTNFSSDIARIDVITQRDAGGYNGYGPFGDGFSVYLAVVPEPSSLLLLGTFCVFGFRRQRRRA